MMDKDALNYNPFEGERDTNTRQLSNKMLTARAAHTCIICCGGIVPKERVRALTEVNYDDHQVKTFYFCGPCCEAMALSWTDNGKAICERTAIGMQKSGVLV